MIKEALTYDDIQLVPKYSTISSRQSIKLHTLVSKRYGIWTPIIGSPMDTVCESDMAIALMKAGGLGIIHRFMTTEKQVAEVAKVKEARTQEMYENWGVMYDDWHAEIKDIPVCAAVGANGDFLERSYRLIEAGANIILIDVAHGHHENVKYAIKAIKALNDKVDVIAGNIATADAAVDLIDWGVDALRVGVGGGCFTPNMKVKTSSGDIPIIDINIGEMVYSHNGELNEVINKFEFDREEEIMVINNIECTKNHEFYVIHRQDLDKIKQDSDISKFSLWIEASYLSSDYVLVEVA